jgi:hypothetical protein
MKAPILLLALLAFAACDSGTVGSEPVATETHAVAEPAPPARPRADAIPDALLGRWGLTVADCEPGRVGAEGLLTVTANRLEFYESVGTLDEIREVAGEHIRATFDFTGEGMEWERDMALELQEAGGALVRREYGTDAAPGSFRYVKCN